LHNIGAQFLESSPKGVVPQTYIDQKEKIMFSVKDLGELEVFLFDCDGVLFRGSQAIEGAAEVIVRLKENGKRVFFVTNNATKSRADNVVKLVGMGIPAREDEVVCAAFSASCYARDQGFKSAFVVGESGLVDELILAGLTTTQEGDVRCDVVVAGLDRHFSYEKLARAQACIQQGAEFVATNRDATYPSDGGKLMPGIIISIF
jgi:HAD superfamily hydrolase (TIGR01450 family)